MRSSRAREVTQDMPECVGQTTPSADHQANPGAERQIEPKAEASVEVPQVRAGTRRPPPYPCTRATHPDTPTRRHADTPKDPNSAPPRLISMSPYRRRTATAFLLLLLLTPSPAAARSAYEWPLQPRPVLTRPFDPPAQRWQPGHRGVDLGARGGAAVLAARAGTVTFAGPVVDRGVVSVLHPDGVTTTYEPVTPRVRRGEHVRTGQVLGYLDAGHRGCTAAACLHWGARRGAGRSAEYLNPLGLLGVLRVRLKPVV